MTTVTATKPLIYWTVEGIQIPYGPVSSKLIGMVGAKYPTDVPPPTYKFKDVTEENIEMPHDEESIKSDGTPESEKLAWAAYLVEKERLLAKHNEEIIRVCLLQGVKLSPPEDDSWLDAYRYLEVDIPDPIDNPHDFKLFWLFTEVLKSEHDTYELTRSIMNGANSLREMRAVAASTFLDSVGKRNGADLGATSSEDSREQQGVVA